MHFLSHMAWRTVSTGHAYSTLNKMGFKTCKFPPQMWLVATWKNTSSSSSSSSVGCRAGDYELPPATTILCQFRQLARANHVVCVSQKVLNVSEKQGSLPSWFSLPMWWNIQWSWSSWSQAGRGLSLSSPSSLALIKRPQLVGNCPAGQFWLFVISLSHAAFDSQFSQNETKLASCLQV